jgi:hypothetical protein
MTDPHEQILAPTAIERAMEIYEKFKDRDHVELTAARKVLREHIFGLIAKGETDPQRLVVSGLARLKLLEKQGRADET